MRVGVNVMVNYCAYCGTKLDPDYKFCPGCDAEIRTDEAKRMAPMTGQPVPVATGNIPIATGSPLFDPEKHLYPANESDRHRLSKSNPTDDY
jgi:hypothetical protein